MASVFLFLPSWRQSTSCVTELLMSSSPPRIQKKQLPFWAGSLNMSPIFTFRVTSKPWKNLQTLTWSQLTAVLMPILKFACRMTSTILAKFHHTMIFPECFWVQLVHLRRNHSNAIMDLINMSMSVANVRSLLAQQLSGRWAPFRATAQLNSLWAVLDAAMTSLLESGMPATGRWKKLMDSMGNRLEENRINYKRLALTETRTKSPASQRMKFLLMDNQQPGKCLHPTATLTSRSNQYTDWTTCGKCQARITYTSKRSTTMSAPKGKARPPTPAAASATSRIVEEAIGSMQVQNTQLGQVLTQISSSLQELARGQSQLIMMNATQQPVSPTATQSWDEVMENPNSSPEAEGWDGPPGCCCRASSMSVASMVSWSQCSTELQKLLLQHTLDENAVVFRHCPKSLRPEPFEDCGELSHWRQVCHGFQECQDAIECHSAKVCPDSTECPGDSLCHVPPVCPGFQECQDAIECHSAKVCPDSTECPGGSLCHAPKVCHGPKECAASNQCAGGAVHGAESVSSCKPVRPKWLPSYIQCKEALVNDVTEIMLSFSDGWQLLWLQMYDLDTGVCLEDGPRTQGTATFAKPRSVRARCWGLPTSLLSVLQLADNDSNIAVFDEHGGFSEQGPFWAFKASVWRQEIGDEDDCCEQKVRQRDEDHSHKNLTWLARRASDVSGQSKLDFVELFSPPRVTPIARDHGLRVDTSQIFDLKHGWDVRKKAHRVKFRKFRKDRKPRMLMASPECRAFTQWRHLNRKHMSEQTLKRDLEEGHLQWNFSLEAARDQLADGLHFGLEHPQGAETWELPQTQKLLARDDVALMTFDQCAFGLRVQEGSDRLSRKSTKIATSNPWLAYLLLQAQCSGDHEHLHLEGNYTKKAQEYPPDLCRAIVLSTEHIVSGMIAPSFMQPLSQSETYKDSEKTLQSFFGEEEEEEEITTPIEAREDSRLPLPQLTDSQKRLVRKVHVNTGHSDRHRMLRAFKAAGALPQVLRFVRDEFQCEDCDLKQKTDARRRAQLPRTFSFNKILSVDFLYIRFQEKQIPIFNMVCVGTSYQVAVRAPVPDGSHGGTPTSSTAWRVFLESWVRYFGMPQVSICDSGNEFKSMFERGLELYGVYQHVIHPECPWENGKGERHGGWLKNRLDSEIHGGRCVFTNLPELDEFLSSLTATKNRWLSKGGYTPAQLVFGELPRVPGELLSEDELGNHGLRDAFEDPGEVDEAAGEYRRRHAVRERGRQCAMEQSSREAIIHAQKAAHHPNRHWSVGQWVYVFRRARQSQDLHLRDRWVGPGIVVMTNNDTVYVGMRTRLWRCSASQLRAALPSEVLGRDLMTDPGLAELLRQVISGTHAGAVDVAREGPPPPQYELNPVQRVEDGVEIAQDPALQLPPSSAEAPEQPSEAAPQQMPQPVEPVPPGLGREMSQPWIDQLPEAPPGLAPMTHEKPLTTSRRSSVEEPAAEPPVPTSQMDSIAEEPLETESTSPVAEPPWKAARLDEMSSEVGVGASSSTQPPLQPEGAHSTSTTRAPGTPVARLLRSIPSIQGDLPPLPPTLDSDEEEERQQAFSTEGWSGTYFNYSLGDNTWCSDRQGGWALLAAPKRGGEINLKDLSTEERKMFDEADKLEWQAILNTKAVHVIGKKEADKIRQRFPDRIISSRMVRRKKPQPELHSWKAKSRWCLHGHCDPDTGTLSTYAPTPQAEGIMMFLQTGLNLQMQFAFGDVKNAFCQSFPLRRPRGPLYAEPCEGLHLPPGSLIAIDVPVYGLDDAPAAWRTTVATYLVEDLGFERNLVEPCWYSKFDEHGQCVAQILVEVDDFIIAAQKNHYGSIKESLTNRFKFGKWEESEAEYAGRHIKCTPDCIYVDQSKYIIEQIHPVALQKGRRTQKNSQLTAAEFNALRSLTFKFNWLWRETRPEAAGLASIMASRLPNATIEDVGIANKFVNYLRSTADRTLKLWKFDPHTMCFIAIRRRRDQHERQWSSGWRRASSRCDPRRMDCFGSGNSPRGQTTRQGITNHLALLQTEAQGLQHVWRRDSGHVARSERSRLAPGDVPRCSTPWCPTELLAQLTQPSHDSSPRPVQFRRTSTAVLSDRCEVAFWLSS